MRKGSVGGVRMMCGRDSWKICLVAKAMSLRHCGHRVFSFVKWNNLKRNQRQISKPGEGHTHTANVLKTARPPSLGVFALG